MKKSDEITYRQINEALTKAGLSTEYIKYCIEMIKTSDKKNLSNSKK